MSASTGDTIQVVRCQCGNVEIETIGVPITSVACYCDTCQQGSREIEELPGAGPTLGPDGGTEYILYRKDRIRYARGADRLKDYKTDEKSSTSRVVAACCNSAMLMRFDDAKHWVPMYRARFQGDVPPVQWRICTDFKPADSIIPTDVPQSATYPAGFLWKLLTSKLAMMFGR